ncbi:serine hydrolase domain-containing protein [Actinocatenispora rupis]|uniref:Serine hydrolase n=1 Tax=Actinocatenispora rupis TaxID=519421 RepID=A0A8J3NEK0_9ACTN|nr:serine hydrolase domain-containing protein [Actinocatenispora rupis]GID16146.1 serine hydrolase [Actinocatenispora rupis]
MSEISRRSLLLGATAGAAVAAVGPGLTGAAQAAPRGGAPTVGPGDLRFTPGRTLRPGSAAQVGLRTEVVSAMVPDTARYLATTAENPQHPMYAGATVIAAKDGVVVEYAAVGDAVRYALSGDSVVELPAAQRIPARTDTMWDLASMSKLFTATSVAQFIERGRVELTAPVVRYLPDFAANGKSDITVRHLLTHTSGLIPDPVPSLWAGYTTYAERVAAILATTPSAPPDTAYVYSDLNFLTLGLLVEAVSGQRLDAYVREHVTAPLGLTDTMYTPPASLKPRIAAQEYEPWAGRGLVWGEVHDENAWALGGVAGHAGVFSTARDIAVFAQTYLNGGRYGKARILAEDTVRLMLHDHTSALFPDDPHGLGWELGLNWYMGALASPVTFGHTGYTGTSIVVDPLAGSFVVLLTNRVHPSRDWGSNNIARRAVADDLGLAVPVRPISRSAWYTRTDHATSTLTAPLAAPTRTATLDFALWYDTEPRADTVALSVSADGDLFTSLPFRLSGGGYDWTTDGTVTGYGGRRWLAGRAALPAGTRAVRWTYRTDVNSQGRGVYVDTVRVRDDRGVVFDSTRDGDEARISAIGWTRADG